MTKNKNFGELTRRRFLEGIGASLGGLVIAQVNPYLAYGKTKSLSLVSGPAGGVYYVMGGGLASVISKHADNISVTSELTQGSVDNCKLVHMGKAELGLSFSDIAYEAHQGEGNFKQLGKFGIKTLFVLYNNYLHTVCLDDQGIKAFSDLKGHRISTGSPGSGSEVIALRLLEAHGISPAKDIRRERLGPSEGGNALRDRKVEAFFHMSGIPMPIVMDLAHTPGVDIRLLSHEKGFPKMRENFGPLYLQLNIPRGTYKGIDYDVPVVGNSNLLICHEKMDEHTAYSVVKAVMENTRELAIVHKEAEKINLQSAVIGSPIPFHPGATRYFKDKNVKI